MPCCCMHIIALKVQLQGLVHTISCMVENQKADMNAATSPKFVHQWHERLKWSYKTAQQVIEKENQRIK